MGVFSLNRKDGSKGWYYDFMYNGTRYRKYAGSTKTQAIRAMEKRRNEAINEELGLSGKIKNPKIEEYAIPYLERRKHIRSHKREAVSVRNLLKFFKGKNMVSIIPSNIADYINYRKAMGVSNSTINRELTTLKRMYNLGIKWKDVRYNPVNDVDFLEEPPGRTRFLTIEEAKLLIEYASDHIKPIIKTALNTGMRIGEILSLKWKQVHLEDMITPSIELIETKNNRKRFVPLNNDMINLLFSIKNTSEHVGENNFVFYGARGTPLKSIKKPFKRALEKTGLQDFRFHDLRHTFASHYLMNGGDLISLKEILGHSSLKMVERYSHLSSSYKQNIIKKLDGKF